MLRSEQALLSAHTAIVGTALLIPRSPGLQRMQSLAAAEETLQALPHSSNGCCVSKVSALLADAKRSLKVQRVAKDAAEAAASAAAKVRDAQKGFQRWGPMFSVSQPQSSEPRGTHGPHGPHGITCSIHMRVHMGSQPCLGKACTKLLEGPPSEGPPGAIEALRR